MQSYNDKDNEDILNEKSKENNKHQPPKPREELEIEYAVERIVSYNTMNDGISYCVLWYDYGLTCDT